MSAMGKPVALDASEDEREDRARVRIVRELDIGAADDLYGLDDVVRVFLQPLL